MILSFVSVTFGFKSKYASMSFLFFLIHFSSGIFLPLTLNPRLSKELGTRHRAAIGVTEDTDAVAVVVSEETGLISFVQAGEIKRGVDATKLRALIFEALGVGRRKEKEGPKVTEAETDAEEDIAPVYER